MRHKALLLLSVIALFSSCTVDMYDDFSGEQDNSASDVTTVICTADSFIYEDNYPTRTAADISSSEEIGFLWSEKDTLGIFPSKGDQVCFAMVDGDGASTATIDGGGWGLKSDATYYAYYPFSRKNFDSVNRVKSIPYTYLGQSAILPDDNGIVQLGEYDYMYSNATTPTADGLNLTFKHLGALVRMKITFPADAIYTKLTINSGDRKFPVYGNIDLTAETVTLNPASLSNSIDINLNNIEGVGGEHTTIYFILPPADCSKLLSFYATLTDSNSNEYIAGLALKNIESGKAYSWDIVPTVPETCINLSEAGTSNCYIVPKAGFYGFRAVQGNSSVLVGDIASVEVLWETFNSRVAPSQGDLVSNFVYTYGRITFTASDLKGNALVAAKDKDGNILWSWHIWMTDKPTDQVYYPSDETMLTISTMMDRNLGATSSFKAIGQGAEGLLYQWGRKDPFMGFAGYSGSSTVRSKTYPSSPWRRASSSETIGTIEYTIANPTTFINRSNSNGDWYYTGDTTTDNTRWQSNKTIYDPCPVGYRVPNGGEGGVWAVAFGTSGNYPSWDAACGYDFGYTDEDTLYLTNSSCWYPAAGYWEANGNASHGYRGGYYWSCTPSSTSSKYASILNLNSGAVYPSSFMERASAISIRCQKD